MRLAVIACLVLLAADVTAQTLGQSGNPLPRYATVKGNPVNVRTGPGIGFPIRWVIVKRGVPLKIVEESDDWRRVEDVEGELGWIHVRLLSGSQGALVTGATTQILRRSPSPDAPPVLLAEPGAIGRLEGCGDGWCRLAFEDAEGWLKATSIWGADGGDG